MPNNQTKGLAQGAMMIAIFAVLIAISLYVPLVSIVATFFAPLPLAWYSANYDRNQSIFVAILACGYNILYWWIVDITVFIYLCFNWCCNRY